MNAAVGSLRIPSGVLVVGRAADLIRPETGLQTGDVIHQLNTIPIQSMEALQTAVRQLKAGDSVALPGKYVPHFKPGKELRDRVNGGEDISNN